MLDGYPSTLYILAKYLLNRGETFPLRAAVTSSETLYDFQRAAIEQAFACRVFDYFALAERAVFSHECDRHEGHHIAMEYGLAEVVGPDGAPGEPGHARAAGGHDAAQPGDAADPVRDQRYDLAARSAVQLRPWASSSWTT